MFLHGFMQAGTSSDIFLRQNLEWMSKSTMWAKFSTTASLGVVHRGHIKVRVFLFDGAAGLCFLFYHMTAHDTTLIA